VPAYHPQELLPELRGGQDVDLPADLDDRRGTGADADAQIRWHVGVLGWLLQGQGDRADAGTGGDHDAERDGHQPAQDEHRPGPGGLPAAERGEQLEEPAGECPDRHDDNHHQRGRAGPGQGHDPREVVAVVGANGSGKTTLAKLLAGLYLPSEGRVCWDGRDTREVDRRELLSHAAIVFQDFIRYALSAGDNIAPGRHERALDTAGIVRAAEQAGADRDIGGLPEGYATLLGPAFIDGTDLSTGQWQRVALARTLFRDAPLVILDEPTAALDAKAEHELFARIGELFADRSVLLISHRFSTVRSADRIYVLNEGYVVESGTHEELLAAGGTYAELFTLQASPYQ
jgi:ABC-type cobalamin/Fe3+-siderophores transport system ATPase subunit